MEAHLNKPILFILNCIKNYQNITTNTVPLFLSNGGSAVLSLHTLKYISCFIPGRIAPFGITIETPVSTELSTPPLLSKNPRAVATTWGSSSSKLEGLQKVALRYFLHLFQVVTVV